MKIIEFPNGGEVLDAATTMYPSRLEVVAGRLDVVGQTTMSYGYVVNGVADICTAQMQMRGADGTFFAIPGEFSVDCRGMVVIIQRIGYRGLLVCGRIEETGRLSYIDGCSATMLVPPVRMGDPVLNYLHMPAGIEQSLHTHSSIRLGVVARGRGRIVSRNARCGSLSEAPLAPGSTFLLDAQESHFFSTLNCPDALEVITYHPDSDLGPTDGDHPMLTRTILDDERRP